MKGETVDNIPPVRQPGMQPGPAPNSNDRLLAALGYPFWIVALICLFLEGPKDRPFTRYHAIQALGANAAVWVVLMGIGIFYCVISSISGFIGCLLFPVFFVPWFLLLYYAYLVYTKGDYVEIPVLTDLMVEQGWLKKP